MGMGMRMGGVGLFCGGVVFSALLQAVGGQGR